MSEQQFQSKQQEIFVTSPLKTMLTTPKTLPGIGPEHEKTLTKAGYDVEKLFGIWMQNPEAFPDKLNSYAPALNRQDHLDQITETFRLKWERISSAELGRKHLPQVE